MGVRKMNKSDELLIKLQQQIKESGRDPDRSSVLSLDLDNISYPIRSKALYISYFKVLPNFLEIDRINVRCASDWFLINYSREVWNYHFTQIRNLNGFPDLRHEYYCIYDDLLIHFDFCSKEVSLYFRNTSPDLVNAIADEIEKSFRLDDGAVSSIFLLRSGSGLEIEEMSINNPPIRIDGNYNEDFPEVNKTILDRLNRQNDKGIILLHGKPGTGKTSYIRYLIQSVGKKVIYMPSDLAASVSNPDLLTVLMQHQNSVLVIEDAENIVVDRENDRQSSVSALLNLSDGLLADCLKIQIICSFNTDVSKIDKALMRKGRLIARYEFRELETDLANNLSHSLGYGRPFHSPALLTDIYNQEEMEYGTTNPTTSIGFKIHN